MVDISKCFGNNCMESCKQRCYRYTSIAGIYQSYIEGEGTNTDNFCDMFINNGNHEEVE